MLDIQPAHLELIKKLLKQYVPEAEVWVYGSRANGQSHLGSDLDLVLRNPLELGKPNENWTELKESLRESNLPFLVDVFDWAQIPKTFQQEIERQHISIQFAQNKK